MWFGGERNFMEGWTVPGYSPSLFSYGHVWWKQCSIVKKARCWYMPTYACIKQNTPKRRENTSLCLISHVVLGNLTSTIKEGLVKTSLQACLEIWCHNFSIWCCNTFDNKRGHWLVQGIRDELPIKVGMSTYSCSSVDKKTNIWHHFDFSGKKRNKAFSL